MEPARAAWAKDGEEVAACEGGANWIVAFGRDGEVGAEPSLMPPPGADGAAGAASLMVGAGAGAVGAPAVRRGMVGAGAGGRGAADAVGAAIDGAGGAPMVGAGGAPRLEGVGGDGGATTGGASAAFRVTGTGAFGAVGATGGVGRFSFSLMRGAFL